MQLRPQLHPQLWPVGRTTAAISKSVCNTNPAEKLVTFISRETEDVASLSGGPAIERGKSGFAY